MLASHNVFQELQARVKIPDSKFTVRIFRCSEKLTHNSQVQINAAGTVIQTGQLEVANYSLPASILGSNIGTHDTAVGFFKFIGFMDGDSICRVCHPECKYGCVGVNDDDCIAPTGFLDEEDNGCKNAQFGLGASARCLPTCPEKFFARANHTLESETKITLCTSCHEACNTCDNYDTDFLSEWGGYTQCCGDQERLKFHVSHLLK